MTSLPRLLLVFAAGIAVMAGFAGRAAAQGCQLRLEGLGRIALARPYDPLAQRAGEQRADLTVRRVSGACDFALGAGPGQAAGTSRHMSQGASRLAYGIYTDGNHGRPLRDPDTGGADSLILGRFGGRDQIDLEIAVLVPDGQMVAAGPYADTVVFTLYELVDGVPGRVLDARSVQVTTMVSAVAGFEIVIEGARKALRGGLLGKLDFGEITQGRRLGFDLEARGNLGYDIEIGSENGGVLAGEGQAKDSTIPYLLTLDGRGLDLRQPAQVSAAPATDFGRTVNSHRFEVEIGDVGQAAAGKYRDDITVTVVTR
ncbi:spore coat protein U domain-containing protein [Arenibaculum pallidiluteum]|uniref:spore coat protein U domain-containing protein n=1 Tax=Arenibaculum pallidiluteum TaxID=2812559 RepID=UPI001A95D372|nr:spore coat protein U domain-containing protein [Arenibaculum pallidiluteum]